MVSTAKLCLICKGSRNLCGNNPCPLMIKYKIKPMIQEQLSKEYFGPSTSVFVGYYNYPNVFVGPMASLDTENLKQIESPNSWISKSYAEIIKLRSTLLRSKYKQNIFSRSRFIEENQLLALAKKPTDTELNFLRKPVFKASFSDMTQPHGPSATLKNLRITENIKISRKVENIVFDELKSADQANLLYKKGQDIYKITTILSSGTLGLTRNKKLVPTRWSITAVDDILTKKMLQDIRYFSEISEYYVFESQHLDNHFLILMLPGKFEYENFEAWAPGSTWYDPALEILPEAAKKKMTQPVILKEYEPFQGRKKYAELEGGGYYAARIACIEHLHKIHRQARVIVFREVYEGYNIPLGVWVVRETARQAFKHKPQKFPSLNQALTYINSKLRLPIEKYKKQSTILKQKRLFDFLK